MTQEGLAERIGLTAPSISQLETGKQGFTDKSLEAFAEALGCSPGDLLERNPLVPDPARELEYRLKKATPDQRKQIERFIDFVLSGTDA